MGFFFPDIEPPEGCQWCRFAPIFQSPVENGYAKKQVCLVKNEMVQECTVDDLADFPESWWEEKHLDCPGLAAHVAGTVDSETGDADEKKVPDSV